MSISANDKLYRSYISTLILQHLHNTEFLNKYDVHVGRTILVKKFPCCNLRRKHLSPPEHFLLLTLGSECLRLTY